MTPLLGLTLDELKLVAGRLGLPGYAAGQMAGWLYDKKVSSTDQMTNLSRKHRALLQEQYEIGAAAPMEAVQSADGTVKYLFRAADNRYVETVFIPSAGNRATLCISSQAGCRMGCRFCHTGKQGFGAHLTAGEIINQVHSVPERDRLTNVVLMGMGEPLDNLDEVLKALHVLISDYGYGRSASRITLSTVGIRGKLKRFLDESNCRLAISLHSPLSAQRASWMPAEKAYPIAEIVELLRAYPFGGGRRLSFEYILFKGLNDSLVYAKETVKLLRGLDCRVNLIRFHAGADGGPFQTADEETLIKFRDYLTSHGLYTTIRASHGEDILAACGMLSRTRCNEVHSIIHPINHCLS